MGIDLKSLSATQLTDLVKRAEERIVQLQEDRIARVREKIATLLKSEGLTLEDVFGRARSGPKRKLPTGPKFRNPAKSDEVWSGRGPRPAWFKNALKRGAKEADFLVKRN